MERNFCSKPVIRQLCILLSTFMFTQLSMAADSETVAADEIVLDFHVIDRATKEPVSDVTLEIQINGREVKEQKIWTEKTDADGRCVIKFSDFPVRAFRIYPQKEGFVTLRIFWSGDPTPPKIPDTFTVAMEPATTIGGTVQNEQGEPIEGVVIRLHYYKDDPAGAENARVNIVESSDRIKTDSQGHWRYDKMPSEVDMKELRIFVTHPEYTSDILTRGYIPMPITPQPPIEKLRDLSSVMVMKKGFSVSGRVVDKQGNPVTGAKIYNLDSYWYRSEEPFAETDTEGNFKSNPSKTQPGQTVLTVQASGYAPELESVNVRPDMSALVIRLEPGNTIRGSVTDKNDKPVEGAYVSAREWRGERARLHLETKTDADGNFEIVDAPADEVLFDIGKAGYMLFENYVMKPGQTEYKVQLRPPLKVHGKVIDAETGRPIDKFTVINGFDHEDGRAPQWDNLRIRNFTGGQYEMEYRQEIFTYRLRIDAEGYQSVLSPPIRPEEIPDSDMTFDFKLEKAASLEGTVLSPDGKPLPDADVIVATRQLSIMNGREIAYSSEQNVNLRTDADGRFGFVLPVTRYVIVVLHDLGYAKVTQQEFEDSPTITVTAWGRIEGIYKIGSMPGVDELIAFMHTYQGQNDPPRVSFGYETKTDTDGNFVFPRVIPGTGSVSRVIPINRGRRFSHMVETDVESGQTTRVQIGGNGRSVTGKIVIPDYIKDQYNCEYTDCSLRVISKGNPYKQLSFKVDEDGSFRIDNVPAGDYSLNFTAYGPPPGSQSWRGERIGLVSCIFTVPEMPGGYSDELLELGSLQMEVIGATSLISSLVGKPLPKFENIKIEFDTEQLKGKKILICFFDMNQRPSRRCISQLNEQIKQLKEKDVTVIGIQAAKVDEVTFSDWIKDNNISFSIGKISENTDEVKFNWGVKSLPWLILTDKKHTIIAEGFSIDELDGKI